MYGSTSRFNTVVGPEFTVVQQICGKRISPEAACLDDHPDFVVAETITLAWVFPFQISYRPVRIFRPTLHR
jgi:hypothetical protein